MEKIQLLSQAIDFRFTGNNIKYSILDLGCGTGLYWKDLHLKVGTTLVGVDIRSEQDILFEEGSSFTQTMKSNKGKLRYLEAFKFIHEDVLRYVKTESDCYDLIVCFQLLSLLTKPEAKMLITDCKNILNEKGLIGLCIPNSDFNLIPKDNWPSGISDKFRNKFNLTYEEFISFVDGFNLVFYNENGGYHWALISST
jgi:SAM-dependent methyltransferase